MAAGAVEVAVTSNNSKACANFDGVDDVITATNVFPNFSTVSYTISFWMKRNLIASGDIGDRETILASGNQTNPYFFLNLRSSKFRFRYIDAGEDKTEDNATQEDSKWVQFTCVFDKPNSKIVQYKNGVYTGQKIVDSFEDLNNANLRMGDSGGYYAGALSNVKVWNRVLTTDEIARDYAGTPIPNGLTNRWKLMDDYKDSVGTADGTNSGTYLSIQEDAIAAQIKADRVTANDKYLIAGFNNGQIISTVIEEAP